MRGISWQVLYCEAVKIFPQLGGLPSSSPYHVSYAEDSIHALLPYNHVRVQLGSFTVPQDVLQYCFATHANFRSRISAITDETNHLAILSAHKLNEACRESRKTGRSSHIPYIQLRVARYAL